MYVFDEGVCSMESTVRRMKDAARTRLKRIRLMRALFLIGLCCSSYATTSAAPVTLQFEATVGPPRQGFDGMVPPSWNVVLSQGDTISGTFEFEPLDVPATIARTALVEPHNFTVQIKSQQISTSQYGIEVDNDIFSDEQGFTDRILLGCSSNVAGAECMPSTVSTESLAWSFQLSLSGNSMLLNGADVPADPSVWQQLIFDESFGVTFLDNNAGRSYGFIASPQSIEAVPELYGCAHIIIGISILYCRIRFPYHRTFFIG
jgi:hypothetical protein